MHSERGCHSGQRLVAGVGADPPLCCCFVEIVTYGILGFVNTKRSAPKRAEVPIGPNSLFIRILLDKKYALPYKVVDGLVEHFILLSNTYKGRRDRGQSEKLPVLWHQSLLVFAQRYARVSKSLNQLIVFGTGTRQISPQSKRTPCSTLFGPILMTKSAPKFVENW